jgi:Zn ribbon nucleic-acid-binding protein
MFSNGAGIGIDVRDNTQKAGWYPNERDQLFKNGKSFVRCLCPKCSIRHNVYMLWTGRGMPRKYCVNCKPLVSGYDDAAIYEASICPPGQSRKKGRRLDSE